MSRKRVKQYLMLLTAVGLVSLGAGSSGSFASFNAEVEHSGNYFATGTLFLHATNGGTTCTSESSSTNLVGGGGDNCSVLFSVDATTATPQFAQLTLTNAGTIDADGIKFQAEDQGGNSCVDTKLYVANTTLTQDETTGALQLHVAAATLAVQSGGTVEIVDGGNTEIVTTTSPVSVGDTTIDVTATAHDHANGTAVDSTAEFGGAPSLCGKLQFTITETDASFTTTTQDATGTTGAAGCAYGTATGGSDGCVFDGNNGDTLDTLPTTLTALGLVNGEEGNTGSNLDAGKSRYFLIGVLPNLGATTNQDQAAKASFGLIWHIDQA